MIRLGELKGAPGASRGNKRRGRGAGSGLGDTSGRGHKGLLARKGGGRRIGYEGGQTPLIRRIPKRGFHNFTRKIFAIVDLDFLSKLSMTQVSLEALRKEGLLKGNEPFLKVLGTGKITKKISVRAHGFSKTAKEKLEAAGATVEVIDVRS